MPRTEIQLREPCGACVKLVEPAPACRICGGSGYLSEWHSLDAFILVCSAREAELVAAGAGAIVDPTVGGTPA